MCTAIFISRPHACGDENNKMPFTSVQSFELRIMNFELRVSTGAGTFIKKQKL